MSDPENLNYDCMYNIFLGRAFLPNLSCQQAKQRANRWLRKVQDACCKTIEELKLRNALAYKLAMAIKSGTLGPPFGNDPPTGHLGTALVESEWAGELLALCQASEDENFLVPRPMPKVGVYCCLGVVHQPDSEDEAE